MKMLKKVSLFLIGIALILGLNFGLVKAAEVTIGGGMDVVFQNVLDGAHAEEGKDSIWEYHIHEQQIITTHIHPKIMADISDKVSGETYICFTHHDGISLITAYMEYSPFGGGDFGDNLISMQFGRFLVPFGYFNEIAINPVDQKSVSRPLMYVDHEQEDMELNGGPRPIFMSAYSDIGVNIYGSKWLRGEKDQLWYGVYLINGMYQSEAKYESLSRLYIDWESEPRPIHDNNDNKTIGGRIAYSFGDLFTLGGSYLTGKYDEKGELENTIYGGDIHLALSKANLRFEYAENPLEWIEASGAEAVPEDFYTLGTKKEYTKKGWYVQLDFPFDLVFGETDVAKKFEFVTMYSTLESARSKPNHTFDKMSRVSAGVNFAPDPALKFRLEYQLTLLGDYNETASNVAKYGDHFENLSRIQMSVGLAF